MNKESLISSTKEVYRLTLLFPKKEPLRYKVRELADDILAEYSKKELNQDFVLDSLEILDSFFEVAKNQNWVLLSEVLKIQKEYSKLKEVFSVQLKMLKQVEEVKSVREQDIFSNKEEKKKELMSGTKMNGRQEKILTFLKEQGKAQVWQIKNILPEVTKRTLRRDFDDLFKKGIIKREGEKNNTFYQINGVDSLKEVIAL